MISSDSTDALAIDGDRVLLGCRRFERVELRVEQRRGHVVAVAGRQPAGDLLTGAGQIDEDDALATQKSR